MHDSAIESLKDFKKNYLDLIQTDHEIQVVEIGSYSINSNIKPIFDNKFKYTGLDIKKGPNVDLVLSDSYKLPFDDNTIDAIISISTFEHTDFFWLTYLEILRALKPQGLFFLNVPSNAHYHRHPGDSWRFYPDSANSLEKWGKKNNYNCQVLEHFTNHETGIDVWNDYVSITIKDANFKKGYKSRIIHSKKNFTNGRTDKSFDLIHYSKISQDQNNWGWKIYYKLRKKIWKIKKIIKISK